MIDGEIHVECQMMNPPKPIGFIVTVGGKTVAVLTHDKVGQALTKFWQLEDARTVADRTADRESQGHAD